MPLFLAFLLIPLIEIGLFIQIGGWIGLWPTLLVVVLTAILGTYLVRDQGRKALGELQRSFSELDDPSEPLAHGAMILVAGALLLTPGFFTDGVGFLLLIPGFRAAAFRWLKSRIKVNSFSMGTSQTHRRPTDTTIIDADYQEIDPNKGSSGGPSGWTRH